MSVIYKGKESLTDPSSWREIGKKSRIYKVLSSLLVNRLVLFLEFKSVLPENSYGFRRDRATMDAVRILLDEIDRTLTRKNQYLYAAFLNFRAAFHAGSKKIALENLVAAGVPFNVQLMANTLQENSVFLV